MTRETKSGKLPFMTLAGYGAGTAGDSMPYTLFFTYFIFFMTDVAGVDPAIAGTISFVAIVWQGVTGPIFGYLTDNTRNPKGRRRPFMMKAMIPYVVFIILMFAPVKFDGNAQWIFYLIMAMAMWTCYSAYKGPWDALGAELTDNYKERNMIRFSTGIWAYPLNWIAQSGVMAIVGFFAVKNMAAEGWFYGAIVCAAVVATCGVFCIKTTKGRESMNYIKAVDNEHVSNKRGIVDMFKQYISFLKVKGFRTLVIFQFVFLIGYTIILNGLVYVLSYCAGLSEGQQATFWTINTVICIVLLPVITGIANKIDKKIAITLFIFLNIAINVAFYFIGVSSMLAALVFSLGGAFATTAFYGVFYSLIYDCCDLYELVTGERKEGGIMATALLAQTFGSAVASLVYGWLLKLINYDGMSVPTGETLDGILMMNTIAPSVFMGISLIFLIRYKMTQEKFDAVRQAVEDKKEGKEVDMAQFKDII